MLELKDIFHLPQLDEQVEQLAADGPGLIVVAGLDPQLSAAPLPGRSFLPSGRSAVLRMLMQHLLTVHPEAQCIVVTAERAPLHPPRQMRRRITFTHVDSPDGYPRWIADAARRRPDLLVVDRLCPESAPAALEAAGQGLRVLSQLDTVFRGAGVAHHLLDLGVSPQQLGSLTWVVSVQRLPTLCTDCRQPASPDPVQAERIRRLCPQLDASSTFFRPGGCPDCGHTGLHGDVAVFDVFRADPHAPDFFDQRSALPAEEYALRLAGLGTLSLDDGLLFAANEQRSTYNLLIASQQALADANSAMERKVVELEAANRVLLQRTEALISLEDIGQLLITSSDLDDLAGRVCRRARELCGADRAILYFLRLPDRADVLAVGGWDATTVGQQVDAAAVFGSVPSTEPASFRGIPPGVRQRVSTAPPPRAGLRVPLVAQEQPVGMMIVHTTRKSRFAPGEVALLETFAHHAAVAMQRAGLVEQLRLKIAQLEAAQAELVQKERLDRELELARQVQQSVLPRIFPLVPGYRFAAHNEPARQVGGDLYDVILLDDDHFGLVVADVSDKGMPAALYMALTRSLLLAEGRREHSPRAVLHSVNRLLLELGRPSMFVTVFYGVVEMNTRQMIYARAGHDRPLLLRGDAVEELAGEGTVLGFLDQDELNLSEERVALAPGDRLVLYTDGLTDVLSPRGQPFGRGRLKALLQSHANLPSEGLCGAVFTDLLAYQGSSEQFDDMTMLVVEVQGHDGEQA